MEYNIGESVPVCSLRKDTIFLSKVEAKKKQSVPSTVTPQTAYICKNFQV